MKNIIIIWLLKNNIENKKIKNQEKNNKKIIDEIKLKENNLNNEIEVLEKNNKTQEEYYRDIIAITTKMDLAHV